MTTLDSVSLLSSVCFSASNQMASILDHAGLTSSKIVIRFANSSAETVLGWRTQMGMVRSGHEA